jgi:sugar phosphate isomerase/epimerase
MTPSPKSPARRHPIRRALSTIGCPDCTLERALDLAARFELDAIELRALAGEVDLPAHFARTYGSPAALARAVRDHPVRIAALDTSFKLAGATADARAKLLEHLPWAEALGVRWLRVFDGGAPDDPAALAAAAETLRWWRDLRRARGWSADLMIETHDALVSRAAIDHFLDLAPDAALLWDTHHTWRKGGEDPMTLWPHIRSHVVHLHVRDSVTAAGNDPPYRYVLPGEGEFPMPALLAALQADNYAGPISLEWERLWIPKLPPLEQVLAAAVANHWW